MRSLIQRTRHFPNLKTLDHIAFLQIGIIFKTHAAFKVFAHFAHFFFEALPRLQRALVNHHIVTQQAHLTTALDGAFGDHTTGHLAHF